MADPTLLERRQYYYPGLFVARLVNGIIGVIEVILALRLVLELLGANSSSQFVEWIYSVSGALIGPFANAFPGLSLGGASVIDWVAILAMVGYAILGWLIIQILSWF